MITDISTLDVKRIARRAGAIKNNKQTIKETEYSELAENVLMMQTYRDDWYSLSPFRQRYQRVCKYHRGNQWSDLTTDDDGNTVTEDTYIRDQGKLPLKQNIVRPLAKSLEGLFRSEKGKSIVISRKPKQAELERMMSNTLQAVLQVNNIKEVDARSFDLFILSGLPIQRIGYDFIDKYKRFDVKIDYIDPQYIFFNTDIKDVRLNDLRRIGQLHDVTMDELFVNFAKSEKDKEFLKKLYSGTLRDELLSTYGLSADRGASLDFFVPSEPHKCRVIEVWEKKAVDIIEYWDKAAGEEGVWERSLDELVQINELRIQKFIDVGLPQDKWALIEYTQSVGFKWFYKYLTPFGYVLREGETPYNHGMHPFVMYPYPLINGEVWGPLEDIIDQQKYINRLITLWDFIMGTSAKNTLVLDKNSLDGQSPEQVGVSYRQVGGVIVLDYQGGKNKPPVELGGQLPNLGITELIGMQIKWMQDISGVQPAMQGQQGSANTPASKYAMEIQQTTLNNRDLMESFASFRKDRDMKVLHTFIQFYKDKRYLAISGKDNSQLYDPELIEDISDFDITIGQSMDSPTYKGWIDEMLKDFVINGLIDMEMFLTHSNLPFADALLEDIRNRREQTSQGTMSPQDAVNGVAQNFNQQAQQNGVDMNNMNQVIGMMNPRRGA